MALKAEVEPRKMKPKITGGWRAVLAGFVFGVGGMSNNYFDGNVLTSEVVKISEFSGTPRLGCTRANTFENGMPRSLANAHVIREDVVMIATEAKRRQINGNMRRHVAPGE